MRRFSWIIWACFLLRGFFYAGIVPIWEGYDEWSHFGYLEFMDREHRLPVPTDAISEEVQRSLKLAPLPWMLRDYGQPYLTHDAYWVLTPAERRQRESELSSLQAQSAAGESTARFTLYEAQQPPLYYWVLYLPYKAMASKPLVERVYALRFLSVLLTSLAIPICLATGSLVLRAKAPALQVIALIAILPELMIAIGRVGNESLALVLYSAIVYWTLCLQRDPHNLGLGVLVGGALGLGLLTKAYFLSAIPVLTLLLGWSVYRVRYRRGRVFLNATAVLAISAVISGWWYWRNIKLSGSLTGQMFDSQLRGMPFLSMLRQVGAVQWLRAMDSTFASHIWFGDWSFLVVRSWIYHFLQWVTLAAIAGLFLVAIRLWRRKSNFPVAGADFTSLLLFYVFFLLGLAYHVLITFIAQGQSSSGGWYLYCAVLPEILLVTLGLYALCSQRLRAWLLPAATVSFGLLDIYASVMLLIPYYTGLIYHGPRGLRTWHLQEYLETGFRSVLERLAVNKPALLGPDAIAWLCLFYVVSNVILVFLSFKFARLGGFLSCPDTQLESRPWGSPRSR